MPGLGVRLAIVDGPGGRPTIHRATARPTIFEDEMWMYERGRDEFYARYPINATTGCFYSRDDWNYAAVSDHTDRPASIARISAIASAVSSIVLVGIVARRECKDESDRSDYDDDKTTDCERGDEEEEDETRADGHRRRADTSPKTGRSTFWSLAFGACIAVGFAVALGAAWSVYCALYENQLRYANVLADMAPAECNVTSHGLIRWKSNADGYVSYAVPGIGVTFRVSSSYIPTKTKEGTVLWRTQARPYVMHDTAKMGFSQVGAFHSRHPIGAMITCYYSRKDPDFASVSDASDGLIQVRIGCAAFVLFVFAVALIISLMAIAGCVVCWESAIESWFPEGWPPVAVYFSASRDPISGSHRGADHPKRP